MPRPASARPRTCAARASRCGNPPQAALPPTGTEIAALRTLGKAYAKTLDKLLAQESLHPPFELRAQLATERWTRREAHTDVCCRATAVGTLAVMMLNFVVWLGMAIAAEKNALFSGGVEDPVNQAAIALGAEGGVVVVGTLLGCMMGRCMRAVGEAQAQRAHAVVRSIGELQAQAASQVGELRTRATLLVQREFDPPPASATRQARDHVVVIRAGAEQDADAQH